MPRQKSNLVKATKATGRSLSAKSPAKGPRLGGQQAKKPRGRSSATVPDFIPFATCLLVDRPPNGPDWVHEIKLDGWRLQVRVEDGTATLPHQERPRLQPQLSRTGIAEDDASALTSAAANVRTSESYPTLEIWQGKRIVGRVPQRDGKD